MTRSRRGRRGPRGSVAVVVVAILALLCVAFSVRLARYARGARVELGRAKLSRLTDATRRRLDTLQDRVFITYYVTARDRMPSHLRRVEREVTDLLDALKAAGNVEYQIVDPEPEKPRTGKDERLVVGDLSKFASKRGAAPFRARSVERDAYSEQTVWSTLSIAYGPRPETLISGVGPEHLERLQALIVEHLDQMESPRRPRIAVAAPAGYDQLRAYLGQKADVVNVDLDGGGQVPPDADCLFWIDPKRGDDAKLAAVDELLRRGRTVLIAGSENAAETRRRDDGTYALSVRPSGYPADTILSHFGVRATPGLVCDARDEGVAGTAGPDGKLVTAPFVIRCIGADQDFRSWRNQPNGNLLFEAPTPLALDAESLQDRGWRAEVLATTSDKTWIQPVPAAPIPFGDLKPENGEPVAKQPLMVRLRPRDPWQGSVVLCAASTAFRDGMLQGREAVAHERMMKVFHDAFTSVERLVVNRAGVLPVEPIPPLAAGERALWRSFTVLLVPALLLVVALARGAFARRGEAPAARRVWVRPVAVGAVAAVIAVGAAAKAAGALGARVDLSEGGVNALAPQTRAIAARASTPLEAEIAFSASEKLPPSMRPWPKRIAEKLAEIRRAGARLTVRRVDPDDLDEAGRAQLAASGIEPFKVTTKADEVTTVRTVYGGLRLTSRAAGTPRAEALRFHDAVSMENLEFRLAFALRRLETGKSPTIAFASDVPRPSPAEAWDFSQAGMTSPVGTDVYSVARGVVESCDYRVVHVNPREPRLPDDAAAVVWLQPRRDVSAMYDAVARYLHRGGRVFLAAQHYNIQARQYRGRGFDIVYWPQPQFSDMDLLYFPDIGVELVPEVLFDDLKTRIAAETQVNRAYQRPDLEVQTSALPFLIRGVAANFDPVSVITRSLGDLAFVWGAYVRTADAKLKSFGLAARPLITTSARTWTFPWKGGWLKDETLAGPPKGDGGQPAWLGRLPLAVEVTGTFPEPSEPLKLPGFAPPASAPASAPGDGAPPPASKPALVSTPGGPQGRLVLVGSSEMLKNHRVLDPEFRADHLLLNAVASLALDEDLAAVAARRPVARGFDYVDPGVRRAWRFVVLAAFPAALLVFGVLRALLRSRRPHIPPPPEPVIPAPAALAA